MQNLDTENLNQDQMVPDQDHALMLEHVIQDNHELMYMDAYLSEFLN
ncbi:MAG: hypothetical protein R3Y38_00675 [Rikenellaceae bacterium]